MVVVADNGSSDGSVEMMRRDFPSVIVDIDRSNPGYGAGANRGIARCGGADVLLLNSDTRVRPGTLASLQRYLAAHARAGVVGPRLLNPDTTLQRSTFPFPSPFRPALQHDLFAGLVRHLPIARERYLATWSHSRPRTVPYVMGAALVIRRAAFEAVGGFDESYFMYSEEVDLCYRMRAAGWETHYAPVADVFHVGRASTSQRRAEMLEQVGISSLRFYERHYSGLRLAQARAVLRLGMALRLLRDRLRSWWTADPARRRELADNIAVWQRACRPRGPGARS
jgi:GT2 family glycosyltransferase